MSKINNWLKYYRASLIDGTRGEKNTIIEPVIQRENSFLKGLTIEEVENYWDIEKASTYIYKQKEFATPIRKDYKTVETTKSSSIKNAPLTGNSLDIFNGRQDFEIKINKIEIAPIYITSKVEHGGQIGNTKTHYPFWLPAYLNEFGDLLPPKEKELPSFVRNYLEPNPRDLPTVATMEKLDRELEKIEIRVNSWKEYWEDCERFFTSVTDKKYRDFRVQETHYFTICRSEDNNVTRAILNLYNELISKKSEKYKILEKVLEEKFEPKNHKLIGLDILINENHFGQMSNEFPLSKSQRVAFAQFTSKLNTDVFAINGPPGTGKTTILQSVVANYLVESVINKKKTPLIIGCSTNNQAITNILDSMDLGKPKTLLSQRWLLGVSSFGLYLASTSKGKEESTRKYQFTTSSYLDTDFIKKLDDKSRVEEYRLFFIEKLKTQFTDVNFEDHTEPENLYAKYNTFLYGKIKEVQSKLERGLKVSRGLLEVKQILTKTNLGDVENINSEIEVLKSKKCTNKDYQQKLKDTQLQLIKKYQSLPFYIKYLPFKKFKKIKEVSFKLILQPIISNLDKNLTLYIYHDIIADIDRIILKKILHFNTLEKEKAKLESILNTINSKIDEFNSFFHKWHETYDEQWCQLIEKTGSEYTGTDAIGMAVVKLDISYRYELFWLCVHYREWEYIQDLANCASDTSKERGMHPYQNKFRRLAKLTPLFISTFHTLPRFSNYFKYAKGNTFYKELFDLMIIDEAGQVSPEVAIPSLSFAKKVLAVGDLNQIEPVWNVTKGVDYKNAEKYQVISNEVDFENINTLGLTVSNGSLMKVIRKSTPFSYKHETGEEEKGAYLLEHRRCLNSIIEYSSKYVYKGSLKLMVGNGDDKDYILPPLGYIHVGGTSEKHIGSSRKNLKEANAIVAWILENKENIEKAYGKTLDRSLAIITPFSAQKSIIKGILRKYLGTSIIDNLIIGTVHALQGAERPIILFSAVHDTEDKMLFFDYEGKYNMLNVAITRAKHSFIVFGNMRIFKPTSNSPSGNLAKILFSKDEYALSDTFIYNSTITYPTNQAQRIDTLEQHKAILAESFHKAQKELIIYSPFISIKAIEADTIVNLINEATARGVKVTILTDDYFNNIRGNLKENTVLGRKAIQNTKANLKIVNGIHNKTICIDDNTIIEGSFNWLSTMRDSSSPYFRNETSVILKGGKVKEDIEKIKKTNY